MPNIDIALRLCSENARMKTEDAIKHRNRIPAEDANIALALRMCSENARMKKDDAIKH